MSVNVLTEDKKRQKRNLSTGQVYLFEHLVINENIPFLAPKKVRFTFIDLFASIGGMRIAFQNFGGRCVFSSAIDAQVQKTYAINFGEVPDGDITKINENDIPNHDLFSLIKEINA